MGNGEPSDLDLLGEFKTLLTTVAAATSKEAVMPAVKKAQDAWNQNIDQVAKTHLRDLDTSRKRLAEQTAEFQKLLDRYYSDLGVAYKQLNDILNRSDFGTEARRFGEAFNKSMAELRLGVETLSSQESDITGRFESHEKSFCEAVEKSLDEFRVHLESTQITFNDHWENVSSEVKSEMEAISEQLKKVSSEFTSQTQGALKELTIRLIAEIKQNEISLNALQIALKKTQESYAEFNKRFEKLTTDIDQSKSTIERQISTSTTSIMRAVDSSTKAIGNEQRQAYASTQRLLQQVEERQRAVLDFLQTEQLPLIRQSNKLSIAALTIGIIAVLGVAALIIIPYLQ